MDNAIHAHWGYAANSIKKAFKIIAEVAKRVGQYQKSLKGEGRQSFQRTAELNNLSGRE